MKGSFKDILEKFAADRELHPYESAFWQASDDDKGITCNAELRVNAYADAFEAEIQWLQMDPNTGDIKKIDQIMFVESRPQMQGLWAIHSARFRGADYVNSTYDWDEKLGRFFRAVVRELKQGKLPDLDAIEKTEMSDGGIMGDRRGDGSGRNVKIKTNQLMYDMKGSRGRGF